MVRTVRCFAPNGAILSQLVECMSDPTLISIPMMVKVIPMMVKDTFIIGVIGDPTP